MDIRIRREDDLPELGRLARLVQATDGYPPELPDGDYEYFVGAPSQLSPRSPTDTAWVAVHEELLVGHIALHCRPSPEVVQIATNSVNLEGCEVAAIARLFVHPDFRRQGCGRRLLEQATTTALDLDYAPILDVVDELSAAISLYEVLGWKYLGTTQVAIPGGGQIKEHVYAEPTMLASRPI